MIVTWPEVTQLNPHLRTYDVMVEDSVGTGFLFAFWYGERHPVAAHGTSALTLTSGYDEYTVRGQLELRRCPEADTYMFDCAEISRSPVLEVADRVVASLGVRNLDTVAPGRQWTEVRVLPRVGLAGTTATWELTRSDRSIATGPAVLRTTKDPDVLRIGVDLPSGLRSGWHGLQVHLVHESTTFGRVEGTITDNFIVDSVPPRLRPHQEIPGTFYPARDGYLDEFWPIASVSEKGPTNWHLSVTDASGRIVRTAAKAGWNGRDERRRLVPEGRYRVTIVARDTAGLTDTWTGAVTVSHRELRTLTYRRTVAAAASVIGKTVGHCSALSKRGRGLVFASEARCRGTDREAIVATNHGMYLPPSLGDYAALRVTMSGGPATRSASNYLVFGYVRGGEFTNRVVFRRGQTHPGRLVRDATRHVLDRDTAKPYLVWSNGLAAGSRYVVRSYTVEIRYDALVHPGAKRYDVATATPQQTSASPRVAASYSS